MSKYVGFLDVENTAKQGICLVDGPFSQIL